jgi:hypothetical protein
MSYDNPQRVQYDFGVIDFGTGSDITKTIEVPTRPGQTQGRAGRVADVILGAVTEDFAGSTLDAGVQVGDGSDADKYYDTGRVLDETVDVADNALLHLADDGAKVDIELGRSTITVTFQSATGTPTGQAEVSVIVDWF